MDAFAERNVALSLAANQEFVRLRPPALVSVRRAPHQDDASAGGYRDAADFGVMGCDTSEPLERGVEAQELLDGLRNELR